jgi:CheY-like chemotaxis protein
VIRPLHTPWFALALHEVYHLQINAQSVVCALYGRGGRVFPRQKSPKGNRVVHLNYHRTGNCNCDRMTRVLLVEDSADILFLIQTELEWMGYTVDAAPNPVIGLDIARRAVPDIIVSDLHMPEMDGYEFIRHVRQIPELAAVPAIALTGYSMSREVREALSAGFNAYLTKPVDGKTISDMIGRLVGKALKKAS